jgi:hypothetical protein
MPFRPQFLLALEDFSLRLLRCVGQGPSNEPRLGDTLLLVQKGTLLLESGEDQKPIAGGDLVKVPKHRQYRLTSDSVAVVLELVRDRPKQADVTPATD